MPAKRDHTGEKNLDNQSIDGICMIQMSYKYQTHGSPTAASSRMSESPSLSPDKLHKPQPFSIDMMLHKVS
jgi:hypothetical protein